MVGWWLARRWVCLCCVRAGRLVITTHQHRHYPRPTCSIRQQQQGKEGHTLKVAFWRRWRRVCFSYHYYRLPFLCVSLAAAASREGGGCLKGEGEEGGDMGERRWGGFCGLAGGGVGWLIGDDRQRNSRSPSVRSSLLTLRGGWRGLLLLLLLSFLFYTLFGLVGSGLGGRMDDG